MECNWIDMLAMVAPQEGQQVNAKAQLLQMLAMIGLFMLIMWLFVFRPQQKKVKEHREMLSTLKAGDKVMTNSGIVGVVIAVKEKTVSIRSGDSKLEVVQAAVSEIIERGASSSAS